MIKIFPEAEGIRFYVLTPAEPVPVKTLFFRPGYEGAFLVFNAGTKIPIQEFIR